MFKKMIIVLMLVLAMFSLTSCGTVHERSKTTTMTANGTIVNYYIDGTEVTQDIYENFGK